ncbi:acid sphingomyelinase-like phosphodiesterase 3b isoform X4 [Gigantopelta aegis]|uniref:acid sphingomyelinase-like phosphodiesterase 3b isoform X4 n=1 Tax=Gigantopelta aegis TaxID=1735272 RepID=UPI001B88C179|nr:acid sphingomyelinase-like phosphodiesterase 3b isoform X4 [Gigantopelta aegis]
MSVGLKYRTEMRSASISLAFHFLATLVCSTSADVGSFWHVSDQHYDFSYWSDKFSCNSKVPVRGIYGDYWCDSPWKLVADSVAAMKRIKSDVDFILWTGDNVAHIHDEHLSVDKNVEIMKNITDILKQNFPGIKVYATMGNHDYFPSNQYPPYNSELYNRTADLWKDWIGSEEEVNRFRTGAFYTTTASHGIRIMALNTNMYYTADKVTHPANYSDPAGQFAWMEETFTAARVDKEKVIVTGHVPPGVHNPGNLLWFYPEFNTRFNDIIVKFSDVIIGMHFGHDHADGMKIFYKDGQPVVPMFMAPSITPWRFKIPNKVGEAHNPGIRVVTYDRTTGKHLNIIQYYMDLDASNSRNATNWTVGYDAQRVYGISDITAKSLHGLTDKLKKTSSLMDSYVKFRWVLAKPEDRVKGCNKACRESFFCGFKHHDMSSFNKCKEKYVGSAVKAGESCLFVLVMFIFTTYFNI